MNVRHTLLRFCMLLMMVPALFSLAACDSGDDGVDPSEVAGTYVFTQLFFNPTTPALQNVNVLDTLVRANTRLRLFQDGQYTLEFQFEGGPQSVASGNFSVSASQVSLRSDQSDEGRLRSLLLDPSTTLSRGAPGAVTLTANISKTVNLETFSPQYQGLTAIPGVLTISLTR